MAKLDKMPSLAIINGFKGTVDFYYWMGIPVARAWPRSPGHARSPSVQSTWPAFTWAAKSWFHLSQEVRDAYTQLSVSTNMTGRDIFMKSFIQGATLYLEGD